MNGEGRCLLPRHRDAEDVPALSHVLVPFLLVVAAPLFEDHDDAVQLLVVGDADGADDPLVFLGAVEVEVLGQVSGPTQFLDDPPQVAGEDCHLLLLDLDRRLGQALAAIEEEQTAADLADDAEGAMVWCVEVEFVAHRTWLLTTPPARRARRWS